MGSPHTATGCRGLSRLPSGQIRVGISGWTYARWRGDFYPTGLPHTRELAYAAERMTSVEVNGSFYSLQRPTSYARWRDATPDGFVFAVKGSRFITHMKQLVDIDVALANFWASGVLALGPKLGPVLWQLPARTRFDAARLADFFDRLPRWTSEAAGLARGHDEKVPESRALVDAVDERPVQPRSRGEARQLRHARSRGPPASQRHRHRLGRRGRQVPRDRRRHQRGAVRAAARAYRAVCERLQLAVTGPVGAIGAASGRRPDATCTSTSTTTRADAHRGTPSDCSNASTARCAQAWPGPPRRRSSGRERR